MKWLFGVTKVGTGIHDRLAVRPRVGRGFQRDQVTGCRAVRDGGDDVLVGQVGRPGGHDHPGLRDQGLGAAPVAARFTPHGRLLQPAVLAGQRLTSRVSGGCGRTLALRLLLVSRTGLIAPGLLRASLLLARRGHFGFASSLLTQLLLDEGTALRVAQAGQIQVDLRSGLRPSGSSDVHHGAAVLALAASVQPGAVDRGSPPLER
ncbi:hypothetical protein ACFT39_10470 [[Kitasatospora] papulosa]|uniref:hypothetical protein n=1 Tax=Streptomyces TaxID=1883 RepID=UPI00340AC072